MQDFLTKRAECYTLQRLNDLHNEQRLQLGSLRTYHCQGESYAATAAFQEFARLNAEIKALLNLGEMFAEINRLAPQWGAVAPECAAPQGSCGVENMVRLEEVPF